MGEYRVLVHPGQDPQSLESTRIFRIETAPKDYPWRKVTGKNSEVPPWDTPYEDLMSAGWQGQSVQELGLVMGESKI